MASPRWLSEYFNTIRNGDVVPPATLGNDGDFYLDTSTSLLYGPKLDDAWGAPTSMVALEVPIEKILLAAVADTTADSVAPIVVAALKIDPNVWPAAFNGRTRVVKFEATAHTTNISAAPNVRLYDLTNGVSVATLAPTPSLTPAHAVTALTVGTASGNLRSDVASIYEVRLYRSGGTASDTVACSGARLIVTYE
jgi:hypothetical protein